jgi:hypothetical protein
MGDEIPSPKLGLKVPFPITRWFSRISANTCDVDSDKSVNPTERRGNSTFSIALIRNKLVLLVEVISTISHIPRGSKKYQ